MTPEEIFTAEQAAQKSRCRFRLWFGNFTAEQAAQKRYGEDRESRNRFTAE